MGLCHYGKCRGDPGFGAPAFSRRQHVSFCQTLHEIQRLILMYVLVCGVRQSTAVPSLS